MARAALALAPRSANRSVWHRRGRIGDRRVVGSGCRVFGEGVVGVEPVGNVVCFRALSEQAVSEVADLGLELSDLLFESVFA